MYCTLWWWCRETIRTFFVFLCTLLFLIILSLEKILLSTSNFSFSTLMLFFTLMSHLPLKQVQMKETEIYINGNCYVLIQRMLQLHAIFFLCRWFLFVLMPLLATTYFLLFILFYFKVFFKVHSMCSFNSLVYDGCSGKMPVLQFFTNINLNKIITMLIFMQIEFPCFLIFESDVAQKIRTPAAV